jgi:hypothetical protein
MLSHSLTLYWHALLININPGWSQIVDIKPLELILKFGANLLGRVHITEVYTGLYLKYFHM